MALSADQLRRTCIPYLAGRKWSGLGLDPAVAATGTRGLATCRRAQAGQCGGRGGSSAAIRRGRV
eukprot:365810-Chlamydomonas_euryale.AAC.5